MGDRTRPAAERFTAMDHDDWWVTISFLDRLHAERAKILFPRHQLAEDARRRLGGSIAVGAGGSQVFLYAGTEAAAREAQTVAQEVLAQHHFRAEFAIHRWHPVEQEWEDPGVALPPISAERQAEHQRLMAEETAESRAIGNAQWQVRAELPTHREAVTLAGKLRAERRPVIRRWTFLVAPASNEDEAQELADQIRREAPADATVHAGHTPVRRRVRRHHDPDRDDPAVRQRRGRAGAHLGRQRRHRRRAGRLLPPLPGLPGAHLDLPHLLRPVPAWVVLGLWFLYQLIEANFGLFSTSANGGGTAFFAHVGGFLFGLGATWLLARAAQVAPPGGIARPHRVPGGDGGQ